MQVLLEHRAISEDERPAGKGVEAERIRLLGRVDLTVDDRRQVDLLRLGGRIVRFLLRDFDKVVRNASDPDLLNPAYNCGDGIHPSSIGYYQMGKSVDLGLFGLSGAACRLDVGDRLLARISIAVVVHDHVVPALCQATRDRRPDTYNGIVKG